MARRHDVQDGTGVIAAARPDGVTILQQHSTPTNSVKGYTPGCIWINMSGTAGTVLYVNIGTASSTTWVAIA